jgi:ABC-type sugar transport system permease subunit
MSLVSGFFKWELTGTGEFIGFENYKNLFADPVFWKSITNTLWFVAFVVPASIVFPLFFATLLNQIKRLKSLFRMMYFLPFVTSLVQFRLCGRSSSPTGRPGQQHAGMDWNIATEMAV